MIEAQLRKLWGPLAGKKPHMPHFLSDLELRGLRGIHDLRVNFDYPVTVIAGGNASGKSTILFAAACAYRVPGAHVRSFVPSTLFPKYRPKMGQHTDEDGDVDIQFDYSTPQGRMSMQWRRRKSGWNRRVRDWNGGGQPERPVYLRTLSNLSNPSEVRGVLSMSHLKSLPKATPLSASQLEFAHHMLPFRYREVLDLSSGTKSLLYAAQRRGATYSELQMSAGERTILRLAQEIAQLDGALVLIDEVEAGLHPWVQKLLMLHLQQLALRNDLQVVVTSHSPVVLDTVPDTGRIFLERDASGQVSVRPPYRDLVQDALYGRSSESLNVLCEDDAAEGILQGLFDVLLPRERAKRDAVRVGRDTGADEFPTHAAAFRKFGQVESFVFVLDGDRRCSGVERKIRENAGWNVPVLFLPSDEAPEVWVWDRLRKIPAETLELGIGREELTVRMDRLDAVYDAASDKRSVIAKTKLRDLSNGLGWDVPDVCRVVSRVETQSNESDLQPLVENLKDALLSWRSALD